MRHPNGVVIAAAAAMSSVMTHLARKFSLMTLLLLVPGVSFAAQEPAPAPAPVPGTETPAPLSLVDPPPEPEKRVSTGGRVGAEVGGALLGTLGGSLAGAGLGFALGSDEGLKAFSSSEVGLAIGGVIGAGLGAYWAGEAMDGRGNLFTAILGAGGGALLVAALSSGSESESKILLYPLGGLVGAVVGYELSRGTAPEKKPTAPEKKPTAPAGASVQPLLGVSGSGAVLGLGGSF